MELLAQMSNGPIYWVFTQILAGLERASPMLMLVCADALFVNILVANFIKIIYKLKKISLETPQIFFMNFKNLIV